MSLRFRQDLHKRADIFCIHNLLSTKVITSSLPCLQSPRHDQGNKVGLLGNMRLDQDVQNVLVWLNKILRAVLFIRLTTEEGKWGNFPKIAAYFLLLGLFVINIPAKFIQTKKKLSIWTCFSNIWGLFNMGRSMSVCPGRCSDDQQKILHTLIPRLEIPYNYKDI